MSANLHVDCGSTALFCPSISTLSGPSATVVGQIVDMSNSDAFCNIYVAAGACSGPLVIAVQTAPGQFDSPPGVPVQSGAATVYSGYNIFSGSQPLSGFFTDPTSGLSQFPTWLISGGLLVVNSGLWTLPGAQGSPGSGTSSGQTFYPQLVNGYPIGTLPFGPNPIQHGQGGFGIPALWPSSGGAAPIFCSGGMAFAAFQRPQQYARLVLLSGASLPQFVQAGFFAQLMTTGSGSYSQAPQNPTNQVLV